MKIYTKTGDDGTTGIIGGARVPKCDPRIEAIGSIDELNASIGVLFEQTPALTDQEEHRRALLSTIQSDLFTLGSQLADPEAKYVKTGLGEGAVEALEKAIDARESTLPELKNFILPAGTAWAAKAHLARAICRRAERRMIELNATQKLPPVVIKYINRLSDLLFVLAREDVAQNNGVEKIWKL